MAIALESIGNMNKAQKYYKKSNEIIGYDPENRVLGEDGKTMTDKTEPEQETSRLADQIKEIKQAQEAETPSKSSIAKDVFTKKSVFKEFLSFVLNGFKMKDHDES